MEKIRVEVVEPEGFMDGALKRDFGDIFSSINGLEFVRLGWCKNVDTGEVGNRVQGTQTISITDVITKVG